MKYGNCETCKFTKSIPYGHFQQGSSLKLWCVRFPPHPRENPLASSAYPTVSEDDGCWEYQENSK